MKYRYSDETCPSPKEESNSIIFPLNYKANNLTRNWLKRDYKIMWETVKGLRPYHTSLCLISCYNRGIEIEGNLLIFLKERLSSIT